MRRATYSIFAKSVVLVTGASSGLGEEFARQVAPVASTLVLMARRKERLDALAAALREAHPNLRVHIEAVDLGDALALDRAVRNVESSVGSIDVLINNAGLGDVALFDRTDWAKLEAMLNVNVRALMYLSRTLIPGMLERRRGGILNVSSGMGLDFMPGFAGYAGSKHFVTAMTECIRLDLVGSGLHICQVCPGPIETEFEAIAGVPPELAPPRFLKMSARDCVRLTLASFEMNRALILPGLAMKIAMTLSAIFPRWMRRLAYRGVSNRLRAIDSRGRSVGLPAE